MRQDLYSRIGDIIDTRHAELCTNLVGASCGLVARQGSFCKVPALLGDVLDESRSLKICLWDCDIKDARPRRDIDGYSHVHALFGCCRAGEQRQ